MTYFTYILYSPSSDQFYIGETEDVELRLAQHNSGFFKGSFTSKANDWSVFLAVEFPIRKSARNFEQFIKRMKSKKFIRSLKSDINKLNDLMVKFDGIGLKK